MSDVKDYFEGGLTTEGLEKKTYDSGPVPEGKYEGKIVNASAEINPDSWSDGEHLKLEFEITSESSKGRHLWKTITLVDEDPKRVAWGKESIMLLMSAAGVGSLTTFDQLIGKVVGFTVGVNDNGYNTVKYWSVARGESPKSEKPVENDSDKNPWD